MLLNSILSKDLYSLAAAPKRPLGSRKVARSPSIAAAVSYQAAVIIVCASPLSLN